MHYLKGNGAISLHAEQDADIILERFVPYRRRLKAETVAHLGTGKIVKKPIEMGSYQVRLRRAGLEMSFIPYLSRGAHFTGLNPQGDTHLIRHLSPSDWGPQQCYVQADGLGGGRSRGRTGFTRRKVWVDDCVVFNFPVTNRQYLQFLNALVQRGCVEDALKHAPRERAGQDGREGALIWSQNTAGLLSLTTDADGLM